MLTPASLWNFTARLDTDDVKYVVLLAGVIVIMLVSIVSYVLTKSMTKSSNDPNHGDAQYPLVIALGILTFIALMGALLTSSSDAYTLAATGMGAIAGAVTASWNQVRRIAERNSARLDTLEEDLPPTQD